MLKTPIIHPELLQGLAEAGHGARILLADSNYAVTVKANPGARRIHLNFVPGIVGGVDVLRALVQTIPIESAVYMTPPDGKMTPIVAEYRRLVPRSAPFAGLKRLEFHAEASGPDTMLILATGEQRDYANLLMTVGVVLPKDKRK